MTDLFEYSCVILVIGNQTAGAISDLGNFLTEHIY
jgi:hypothetical protein